MAQKMYKLTDQQLVNLDQFLKRAKLKGSEVPAYVELVNAFNSPVIVEEKQPPVITNVENTTENV